MEELQGYVSDIIYRNDLNFYTVFTVETEDGEVTCTGAPADLSMGEHLAMSGEYRVHPTYGEQFAMDSFRVLPPEGSAQIERYLGSGAVKGIGAALAKRIVKRFGDDTLRIIEEEPERLAEVKGISANKAREIAGQMEDRRDLRDAMMYLTQFGISNTFALRIYQAYGMNLYRVLKENPYRLAEDIDGIGFTKADEIAARIGITPDSDQRIRCGILYVLSTVLGEGSSCLTRDALVKRAGTLLRIPAETVDIQIDNLAFERKLIIRKEQQSAGENDPENELVYSADAYYKELQIARMLLDLNGMRPQGTDDAAVIDERVRQLAAEEKIELAEQQAEAVREAVNNTVLIISGGPGTGKTTTINTIIRYFIEEQMDVLLTAPTGRAAKRMSEATGYEAQTIHRLLGVRPLGDAPDGRDNARGAQGKKENDRRDSGFGRAVFDKDSDNPLEADVIIVDEMSMVDMFLMNALLKAVMPGTRLILVGDVDQLPSVGPGQVLRDLLESDAFHSIRLTKIFRQAAKSDIVMNAHAINEGKMIRIDNRSRDFFFLERADVPVIYKHTVQLIRDKLPGYVHCAPGEIQVLTPMRKGMLGVEVLNEKLQMTLNPEDPAKKEYRHGDLLFREGDKVMQIRNDYQLTWEIRGRYGIAVDKGEGIFNGDSGIIQTINTEAQTMTVCFDENRIVDYPFSSLDELDLAYAVTVHKSQGSEYPAVILPLLSGPPPLFYRNLLYTAVTRAKSCVVILGSREMLQQMIDNVGQNSRRTGLKDRIREQNSDGLRFG